MSERVDSVATTVDSTAPKASLSWLRRRDNAGLPVLNRALPAWLPLAAAVYANRRSVGRRLPRSPAATSPKTRDSVPVLLLNWRLVPLDFMPVVPCRPRWSCSAHGSTGSVCRFARP